MTAPICFIATETTSLRPDRRAWDIAMIRRDGTTDIETQFYVSLVDLDLEDADPFSLDVGRFWDRHPHAESVRDGGAIPYKVWSLDREGGAWDVPEGAVVSAPDAAAIVAAWTHRAHIVGAVPNFDTECLAALLRDNWLTPSWHYHPIDVETLAVGWLARKFDADAQSKAIPPETAAQMRRAEFEPPWSSERLSNALGVELPNEADRHTALGDARWAARVYDRVMGREEEQG